MTLIEAEGIQKAFPGVHALRGVDLKLARGEVLALVGENGAGKSTLIKILAGAFPPDSGILRIEGQEVSFPNPVASRRAGIAVIHQELNLIPALSARENIFLGSERNRFIDHARERAQAMQLFSSLGVALDPDARYRSLSVTQQQTVEIARALSQQARVVVMDEPTAALTQTDAEKLFRNIRQLKSRGIGIIYVSHRLEEIFALADRIMVMRDGSVVGEGPANQFQRRELIEMMVGRKLENEFPIRTGNVGLPRLTVKNLSRGRRVRDVSFHIHRGEILGLTGLAGSGRTETLRLIFGADLPATGAIELDGRELNIRKPGDAIKAGIALLTEDRKGQGLILAQSARLNFGLPNLARFSHLGFVNKGKERRAFERHVNQIGIKLSSIDQTVGTLSGGNQQKVVVAKWLEANCEVILFDEPTRGIDVGAKFEIYQIIQRLAMAGKAILVVSSDFAEVLGISDRILVMHEGRISGEIPTPARATQGEILSLALGHTTSHDLSA